MRAILLGSTLFVSFAYGGALAQAQIKPPAETVKPVQPLTGFGGVAEVPSGNGGKLAEPVRPRDETDAKPPSRPDAPGAGPRTGQASKDVERPAPGAAGPRPDKWRLGDSDPAKRPAPDAGVRRGETGADGSGQRTTPRREAGDRRSPPRGLPETMRPTGEADARPERLRSGKAEAEPRGDSRPRREASGARASGWRGNGGEPREARGRRGSGSRDGYGDAYRSYEVDGGDGRYAGGRGADRDGGPFRVGRPLREGARLRPLPRRYADAYPELGGASYYRDGSDLVVVDPRSGEVVTVLRDGGYVPRRGGGPGPFAGRDPIGQGDYGYGPPPGRVVLPEGNLGYFGPDDVPYDGPQ